MFHYGLLMFINIKNERPAPQDRTIKFFTK